MKTNAGIANKRGSRIATATFSQLLNSTGSSKDGNKLNTKTGLSFSKVSNTAPALMPSQDYNYGGLQW